MSDLTIVRLKLIVDQIGICCDGSRHVHISSGYAVKGMSKYYRVRPDKAIAAFYLSRGGAVVSFDGWDEYRQWLPKHSDADQRYGELFREFCSQLDPSV